MRRTSSRVLICLTVVAGLVLSSVGTAVALPSSSSFGPAIDPYARYDVQAGECSPVEQPGVVAFRSMLQQRYGANGAGITRACNPSTRSAHQSGRAYDWMLDARRPADVAKANEVLGWLLATDEHGNRHAMARRLGVMYIIWNHQMWSAWDADAGWKPYSGWSPHTDHIHFSFSWAGARQETTFWVQPPPPLSRTGFRDVPVGAHYEDAVAWLLEHRITQGRSEGIFDPGGTVTRGQMATFLWNLMGKPDAAPSEAFTDVPEDAYFARAVGWLDSEGLSSGRSSGTFAPQEMMTRGQMASFLWRLAGRPTPAGSHDFADVHPEHHFAVAASWMAEHRISTGMTPQRFGGSEPVSRSQMALFLYRLAQAPDAWSEATVVPSSVHHG